MSCYKLIHTFDWFVIIKGSIKDTVATFMITIPLQSESLGVTLINNMADHTFMMLNPMLRFDRLLSLRVSFCNRLTITEWCLLLAISKEY